MKARPCKQVEGGMKHCEPAEATHVWLHMPGPFPYRLLPVITSGSRRETPCWTWNGDVERPTLKPSIRSTDGKTICHSWVNDGQVQFLADSTHELAGKTMALLDVEDM